VLQGELETLRVDEMCPDELRLPKRVELESDIEELRNGSVGGEPWASHEGYRH
jgi:hypothetical protein